MLSTSRLPLHEELQGVKDTKQRDETVTTVSSYIVQFSSSHRYQHCATLEIRSRSKDKSFPKRVCLNWIPPCRSPRKKDPCPSERGLPLARILHHLVTSLSPPQLGDHSEFTALCYLYLYPNPISSLPLGSISATCSCMSRSPR